jgi:hypothetical protein
VPAYSMCRCCVVQDLSASIRQLKQIEEERMRVPEDQRPPKAEVPRTVRRPRSTTVSTTRPDCADLSCACLVAQIHCMLQCVCLAEPLAPLLSADELLLQAIEQSGLWDLLPGGRTEEGSGSPYGQYTPRSLQGPPMGQCLPAEKILHLPNRTRNADV